MSKHTRAAAFVLALLSAFMAVPVSAEPPPKAKPARVSELDAARLSSTVTKISAIVQSAELQLSPLRARAARILERYDLTLDELLSGAIVIDEDTGAITRKPGPAAAPLKAPPAK